MEDVAAFRAEHRAEHIGPRYNGWLHFATTSLGSLIVIGFAISRVSHPRWWELACVPAFFLIANLGEYFGHRGPMHHRRPGLLIIFERHTLQHHMFYRHDAMAAESPQDFQMVLFPPVMLLFFLGGLAAPIGLLFGFIGTPNLGWLFAATGVGYFLTYEWLHWSYHQREDSFVGQIALVRALRRHHTVHHDLARMTSCNFNITFPIGDALMGTLARKEE
jgi:hypothetical protein